MWLEDRVSLYQGRGVLRGGDRLRTTGVPGESETSVSSPQIDPKGRTGTCLRGRIENDSISQDVSSSRDDQSYGHVSRVDPHPDKGPTAGGTRK